MKKIVCALSLVLMALSAKAIVTDSENQVNVMFNGSPVNLLNLVTKDNSLNALLQLNSSTCFVGNQIEIIHRLNDVFNLAEHSWIPFKNDWKIKLTQATTPNIPEQNKGLGKSIGIEYEIMSGDHKIARFTINPCSR